MTADANTQKKKPENGPAGARFKTDNLQSSYANFCNANSTKEEVVLNFGINNAWDRNETGAVEIDLRHRIVLSPFAAKRLADLLQKLVGEYESRYGSLK
jgi:hypothetical protein